MSLRLGLAALLVVGLLAPAATAAGRPIREWPDNPNAPRLSGEDIALVKSALAKLEACAADGGQRHVVGEIESRCRVLFVLRGEGAARESEKALVMGIVRILGSVSEAWTKETAVRALGRLDAESVRPALPSLLSLLDEHNFVLEGGSEDWAPNLDLKRELVRLIGRLTDLEVDVSTTSFENDIKAVISAAEAASGVRRFRSSPPLWLVQFVRRYDSRRSRLATPAAAPPAPPAPAPVATRWGLTAAASAVSLLLGFAAATLIFRRRSTGSRP